MAMFCNRQLLGYRESAFWSSSVLITNNSNTAWALNFTVGNRALAERSASAYVRCVKR